MKYNIEYIMYVTREVEADSLDEAINKADAMNREDDELHYTELHYANWTDSDGNFYEEDYYN